MRRRTALALIGLGTVLLSPRGAAGEEVGFGFVAAAQADANRFTFGSPGFLIVSDFIDGGGPSAQAVLDSSGVSRAFGSLPYPGETAVSVPGLLAGVGFPGVPNYPFYASAEYPVVPQSSVSDPSGLLAMQASAELRSAVGTARFMPGNENGSGGARSGASVEIAPDGSVRAAAETLQEFLSLGGGLLKINSVHSRSVTKLARGETESASETQLSIRGASVAGQEVVIGPDGISLAGSPAPGSSPDSAAPLREALAQAGIRVRTVSAGAVQGGAAADILRIELLGGLPVSGTPAGRVVLDIGGVRSSVVSAGAASEPPAPPPPQQSPVVDTATAGAPEAVALLEPVPTLTASPSASTSAVASIAAAPRPGFLPPPVLPALSGGSGPLDDAAVAPGDRSAIAPDGAGSAPDGAGAPVRRLETAAATGPVAEQGAAAGIGGLFGLVALGGLTLAGAAHLWRAKGVGR